jgi:prepilin-type processing-associated H-X9-DG protein
MPALAQVRKQAKDITCVMNLKQWGSIFSMYLADHDNNFMVGRDKWFYALRSYYGAQLRLKEARREFKLRFCPTAMKFKDEGAKQPFVAWRDPPDQAELPWSQYYWDGSYGVNSMILNIAGTGAIATRCWKNASVKNTNEIPVMLDAAAFGGRVGATGVVDPAPEIQDAVDTPGARDGDFIKIFSLNRHNGSVNCVFMDFSTRSVGLKELWTLRWCRDWNTCNKEYTMCGNSGRPAPGWAKAVWMTKFKDY